MYIESESKSECDYECDYECDCAANHFEHYYPPAQDIEVYEGSIFNCIVLEYNDGGFMVASADAKGIYGDGYSINEATEDFQRAVECRVFDKQGGIYRGTSSIEFQKSYFYDLENNLENDVIIVNKYHCSVKIFSYLQNYIDTLKTNDNNNGNDYNFTEYLNYMLLKKYYNYNKIQSYEITPVPVTYI